MQKDIPRNRLRRRLKAAAQAVGVIAALAIVIRFAYVVSSIDGGWLILAAQRRAAMPGGDERAEEALPTLEPRQQAAFWLNHVDEIACGLGDPAQLAMGAAWLLDYPSPHYLSKHLQARFGPGSPLSATNTDQAVTEFHELCDANCLAFAKQATDIEPTNVDWWRMRAMLTSSFNLGNDTTWERLRTEQWPDIFDEAARHDPDNALYDYLAATRLWQASGKYDLLPRSTDGEIGSTLAVHDADRFALGTDYFERGQKKKFVAFGESGLPAIFEFLKQSGLPHNVQADLATSSLCLLHSSHLMMQLTRWQMARADERASAGDREGALDLARQCSKALSQIEAAGETTAFEIVFVVFQQQAAVRLLWLAEGERSRLTPGETAAIVNGAREAVLRSKVWHEAANRAAKPKPAPPNFADIVELAVLTCTPKSVGVLFVVGVTTWMFALWLGRRTGARQTVPAWQHAVAWLIAWAASFAVLGMAPAQFISIDKQPWAAAGVVIGVVLLTGGVLFWRSHFRFTLRTLFLTVLISAILCALLAVLHMQMANAGPPSLAVLPQGIGKLDATTVENTLRLAPQSWTAAAWQWFLHSGLFLSAGGGADTCGGMVGTAPVARQRN